ncbi:hypothetical protein SEA_WILLIAMBOONE_38 [Gordonia phage WilliamBoone]|nr:hypothetical protein SEA_WILLIAMBOONE_38 [Gordonia phage WilliamBoone]
MSDYLEVWRDVTTGRTKHGGHSKGERERDLSHVIHNVVISYDATDTDEPDPADKRLRNMRTLRVKAWIPRGSDIRAQDRVKLPDGLFYRIDGKPLERKSGLTGNVARTKVFLVRQEG